MKQIVFLFSEHLIDLFNISMCTRPVKPRVDIQYVRDKLSNKQWIKGA